MRSLGFSHFPTGNEGVLDRSTYTYYMYQCFCPELLAASGRYELKVKLACSVELGSKMSSSFADLTGHEHVANAVTNGINTCFCICFSRLWRNYNDKDLK